MPSRPLVSILTPSFNQASFIGDCLFSVLTQHYPHVEHLVMDGGSTDETLDILSRVYVPHPKRLRWVSESDGGQSDAVNKGLTAAAGEIIGWLNSDDMYIPGAIALVVDHFAKCPRDVLVYGQAIWIDSSGQALAHYPVRPNGNLAAFRDGCFLCQPAVFFRMDLVRKIGILDTSLTTAMDYDYWLRAFRTFPDRIGYLPRCLALSRLHDACKTRRLRRLVHLEGMTVARRHFGEPPIHWVFSWLEEYWNTIRASPGDVVSRAEVFGFLKEAFRLCDRRGRRQIKNRLRNDKRCALNSDDIRIDVDDDGWIRATCAVLVRPSQSKTRLVLVIDTARPTGSTVTLFITEKNGREVGHVVCRTNAVFRIVITISGSEATQLILFCKPTFVPANFEPGSQDHRELSVKIRNVVLESASADGSDFSSGENAVTVELVATDTSSSAIHQAFGC